MWYEDLNFIENPFKDSSSTELISYNDIIDDLLYNINAGNIVVIEGEDGRGKTSLLNIVINRFRGQGRVVYINGNKIENPNIENVLMDRYGFWGRIFNKMPRDMILLMDEVEELSERNLERIKYFYDQNYIKAIVFTTKDRKTPNFSPSLKERIAKIITLKELREDDAVRIIKLRLGNVELFSNEDIKAIFRHSDKNVKLFLENCEKIAEIVVERKLEKADKDIIEGIIGKKEKIVHEEKQEKLDVEKKEEKVKGKKQIKKKEKLEEKDKPKGQIKIIYDDVAENYY